MCDVDKSIAKSTFTWTQLRASASPVQLAPRPWRAQCGASWKTVYFLASISFFRSAGCFHMREQRQKLPGWNGAHAPGLDALTFMIHASSKGLLLISAGESVSFSFTSTTVPEMGLFTSDAACARGGGGVSARTGWTRARRRDAPSPTQRRQSSCPPSRWRPPAAAPRRRRRPAPPGGWHCAQAGWRATLSLDAQPRSPRARSAPRPRRAGGSGSARTCAWSVIPTVPTPPSIFTHCVATRRSVARRRGAGTPPAPRVTRRSAGPPPLWSSRAAAQTTTPARVGTAPSGEPTGGAPFCCSSARRA